MGVPFKTPWVLKQFYKKRIWAYPKGKNCVYLTFDDGPTPEVTYWVLDQLKKFDAKATFFCIGKNVKNHPAIYNRIIQEGHSVGNHTFNHLNGWKTTTSTYLANVAKASKYIPSKLFRPPYGRANFKQANKLQKSGYKIIMWDVLAMDWDQNLAPEKCYQNILKHTHDGSILVFHDSEKAFKNLQNILPDVLKELRRKGFSFKAIKETG